MDFKFNVNGKNHDAAMTNIYGLAHLGIHNSFRMMLFVQADDAEKIEVVKKVNTLFMGTIKFHTSKLEEAFLAKRPMHFSLTGQKKDLQAVRDVLGLRGEDAEEEIEDFDSDDGLPIAELLSLKF
jgi:hypothetical protein